MSVYGSQSMALDSQDCLYVWGLNHNDSLGFSNKTVISHPTRLTQFSGIVDFSCGNGFALVVASGFAQEESSEATPNQQKKLKKLKKRGGSTASQGSFKQDCFNIVKSKIEVFKSTQRHKEDILSKIELDHFTKYSAQQMAKIQKQSIANQSIVVGPRRTRANTMYMDSQLCSSTMVRHASILKTNCDINKYFKDSQKAHMQKKD